MVTYRNIEVIQADIDKADPKKSGRCVVATAIARTIPDAHRIEVDVQTVRFTQNGERYVYVTPYPVSGYVVAFDAGEPIHPFRFRLNEASRVGMKRQTRTKAGKAVAAAESKVRDRKKKVEKLARAAKDPAVLTPSRAERQLAAERVDEAEAARASVMAAYGEQQQYEHGPGERKPPARSVYKTGRREYGQRRMAINRITPT
jgi:hypothetical protein